jgi:DNA-binding response OmpR family regulator
MRLLIVEDNVGFQTFLRLHLEEKCFAVDTASTGEEGAKLAEKNRYDLVVLDRTLPDGDGCTLCRELREAGCLVPIIMTSDKNTLEHKMDCFASGADDYLAKPFYFEELVARIFAILRRPISQALPLITFADLSLDRDRQSAVRGKTKVLLTRKQFAVLELLLKNAGRVVSRTEIMEAVWDGGGDIFSRTIETHIFNLRKKINLPKRRPLIHSVPGRGYLLGEK